MQHLKREHISKINLSKIYLGLLLIQNILKLLRYCVWTHNTLIWVYVFEAPILNVSAMIQSQSFLTSNQGHLNVLLTSFKW